MRELILILAVVALVTSHAIETGEKTNSSALEKTDSVTLDLMEAPTAPAFTILGVSSTLIERQNQPKDIRFLTNGDVQKLSVLPKNYAVELSPYWFLFGKYVTYDMYSGESWENPIQSLALSLATVPASDISIYDNSQSLGLGISTAILRGTIDKKFQKYEEQLNSLYNNMYTIHKAFIELSEDYENKDPLYTKLYEINNYIIKKNKDGAMNGIQEAISIITNSNVISEGNNYIESLNGIYDELINFDENNRKHYIGEISDIANIRYNHIINDVNNNIYKQYKEQYDNIKDIVSKMKIKRDGWKLNISAATALEYHLDEAGKIVGYSGNNRKWAGWGAVEYEVPESCFDFLACGRYISYPHESDKSSTDAGGRIILNQYDEGLAYSIEYLRRIKPVQDWRLAAVFDFCFAKNTVASISLGRDFGNTLASTLNFSIGLGSKRNIALVP